MWLLPARAADELPICLFVPLPACLVHYKGGGASFHSSCFILRVLPCRIMDHGSCTNAIVYSGVRVFHVSCAACRSEDAIVELAMDRLAVNLGREIVKIVPG